MKTDSRDTPLMGMRLRIGRSAAHALTFNNRPYILPPVFFSDEAQGEALWQYKALRLLRYAILHLPAGQMKLDPENSWHRSVLKGMQGERLFFLPDSPLMKTATSFTKFCLMCLEQAGRYDDEVYAYAWVVWENTDAILSETEKLAEVLWLQHQATQTRKLFHSLMNDLDTIPLIELLQSEAKGSTRGPRTIQAHFNKGRQSYGG